MKRLSRLLLFAALAMLVMGVFAAPASAQIYSGIQGFYCYFDGPQGHASVGGIDGTAKLEALGDDGVTWIPVATQPCFGIDGAFDFDWLVPGKTYRVTLTHPWASTIQRTVVTPPAGGGLDMGYLAAQDVKGGTYYAVAMNGKVQVMGTTTWTLEKWNAATKQWSVMNTGVTTNALYSDHIGLMQPGAYRLSYADTSSWTIAPQKFVLSAGEIARVNLKATAVGAR